MSEFPRYKLSRLKALTQGIRVLNRILFLAICVTIGLIVIASSKQQASQLAAMKVQLEEAKEREFQANIEKEGRATEYKALRFDPAYLEVKARDRLDYSAEGERVLRFHATP